MSKLKAHWSHSGNTSRLNIDDLSDLVKISIPSVDKIDETWMSVRFKIGNDSFTITDEMRITFKRNESNIIETSGPKISYVRALLFGHIEPPSR